MSLPCIQATMELLPKIRSDAAGLEPKRRPAPERLQLVALCLANRYRDATGCCDDTAQQVADALGLPVWSARECLAALENLGYWTVERRGNQHVGGSKRRPTFLPTDGASRGQARDAPDSASRGQARDAPDSASRGGTMSIAGWDRVHRGVEHGASRGQPRDSTSSTSSTSLHATDDETTAGQHLERNIAANEIRNVDAYRLSQLAKVTAVIADARATGSDPTPELERRWPTTRRTPTGAQHLADGDVFLPGSGRVGDRTELSPAAAAALAELDRRDDCA
jgi:hypothetical protein